VAASDRDVLEVQITKCFAVQTQLLDTPFHSSPH
jgi:hypothetical protein